MFRNLYADSRRIFFSRSFYVSIAIIFLYQLIASLLIWALTAFLSEGQVASDEIAFLYPSIAAFIVTISTLFITQRDFEDGCIRNKLISGVKRSDAFLSAVVCGILQGALLTIVAFVSSMIVMPILSKGFMDFSIPEMADYWLVITLACMSIGAFSTALIMIMGGSKISYVAGLAVAFLLKMLGTHVLYKLYPDKGNCMLTGSTLELYKFIDRYNPYSYLLDEPHWDSLSYIVGCTGLVVISVVVGIIVFTKKEIR